MKQDKINYRKAKISDVESIHSLITHFASKDQMLARSLSSLYEGVREFIVAEAEGRVIGAGALHIIWNDLAEIRSLAVEENYQHQKIGYHMVETFLGEAWDLGIHTVLALTYQDKFFCKCGFQLIAKEDLPHKVWKDCINCPKFPNCDEIAVTKQLG